MAAEGDGANETATRWEGYSDYKIVSIRVGETLEDAVEAYARLDSLHVENAPIEPELAAEARARIKTAAMKLLPELENDRDVVELYDDILTKWTGHNGYLQKLNDTQLQHECPPWLYDMVVDIRRAGWELGYLQAGRAAEQDPDNPDERQQREVKQMFRE